MATIQDDNEARVLAAAIADGRLTGPARDRAMAALRAYSAGPAAAYQARREEEAAAQRASQRAAGTAALMGAADAPRRVVESAAQVGTALGEWAGLLPEGSVAEQAAERSLRRGLATDFDPRAEQAADVAETALYMLPGGTLLGGGLRRAGVNLPGVTRPETWLGAVGRGAATGAAAGTLAQPANEAAQTPGDVASARALGTVVGAGAGGVVGATGGTVPGIRNFLGRQLASMEESNATRAMLDDARIFMGENARLGFPTTQGTRVGGAPFTVSQTSGNAVARHISLQTAATKAQNFFTQQFEIFAQRTEDLAYTIASRAGKGASAQEIVQKVHKAWRQADANAWQAANTHYGARLAEVRSLAQQARGGTAITYQNFGRAMMNGASRTGEPWWKLVDPGADALAPQYRQIDDYLRGLGERPGAMGAASGSSFQMPLDNVIDLRRGLSMADAGYYRKLLDNPNPSPQELAAHRARREAIAAIDADIDDYITRTIGAPPTPQNIGAYLQQEGGAPDPGVAAILKYRAANKEYEAVRAARTEAQQTAVAQLFGFRVPDDPQKALVMIAGREPAQQQELVKILKETSPETIGQLRAWIVNDAVRKMRDMTGQPGVLGNVDPKAWANAITNEYGKVLGSELFTPAQKGMLERGLSTVRVLYNDAVMRSVANPERAANVQGIVMALASRSEAFIARGLIRVFTLGSVENLLFTPEGLRSLEVIRKTYTKPTEETARALAKAMAIAGVPEEDNVVQ